jgi:hypothetical protein
MRRAAVQIAVQLVSKVGEDEGLRAVMGIVLMTAIRARCMRQPVPVVGSRPRCHSSHEMIGLFTVEIATSHNREVAQTTADHGGNPPIP